VPLLQLAFAGSVGLEVLATLPEEDVKGALAADRIKALDALGMRW